MTLLPDSVSNTIVDIFGDRGRDWIARLPRLRDTQLETWGLSVTGPPFSGGTHSYVVPVRRGGEDAVLKLPVVDDENFAEATALHHYGGDGAVQCQRRDPDGTRGMNRSAASVHTQLLPWLVAREASSLSIHASTFVKGTRPPSPAVRRLAHVNSTVSLVPWLFSATSW